MLNAPGNEVIIFKQRENRTRVSVTARMRVGDRWQDVSIRNVSSRGMMLSAAEPPPAGAYIEIRKRMMIVIARAVWVRDESFGIRTQDRVDLAELLENAAPQPKDGKPVADRRARSRVAATAERNRELGRRFQFVIVLAAIVACAAFLAIQVSELLAAPLDAVRRALGGA